MIISFETQLGSFAEEIKKELCNNKEKQLNLSECSIFLRDPKKDTFILRASTTGSNYLGKPQLDTSDSNLKKYNNKDFENIGITVSSLFVGEPLICDDLINNERFSCYNKNEEDIIEWECSNFCEYKASEILSILVFPFKTSAEDQLSHDGVLRIVRKKGYGRRFHKNDIDKINKLVSERAPWIKSSVFLSQLIEIGTYSDIPHLCNQAALTLKNLLKGKGCSIFLIDENDSHGDTIRYKPFGTTKLVKKTKVGSDGEKYNYDPIHDPLNDPQAWYDYEKKYDTPNKGNEMPNLPLTLGVIRARMPAFIDDLENEDEITNQFPKKFQIQRKPGHGKVCEFYLDEIEGKYQTTESILYAPMFYGDQNNPFSDVMGVIRIVRPPTGRGPFSVQEKHLFVSIVEKLSEAITSAFFLRDLYKLSEIKDHKNVFGKTVSIINKYIGGNDCALLIERNNFLYKCSEWRNGKTIYIDKDQTPYDLGNKEQLGYTGYVFTKKVPLMFNDSSKLEYKSNAERPKHRDSSGKIPRRFIGVPIYKDEEKKKAIGVLRICNKDMSRKFTDNDRRMLELIGKSIRPRIEEFNEKSDIILERNKIFSVTLQKQIFNLKETTSKDILIYFFKNIHPGNRIEIEILDIFKTLWTFYEPEYDLNTKLFKDFELFNSNILSEIPHYRDHFIHQFIVFLMGLIIIDKLDNIFISAFNDAYKNTSISETKKTKENKNNIKKFIEFTWLKTAFFHDIAYPIQSVETWVTNILKKYLKGYRLDFKTRLPLGEIFFDPGYIDLIDILVSFHKVELKRRDEGLREIIIDLLYNKENKPDHGIISALLLVGENQFDRDDILPCASAIALHNKLLVTKNIEKITFEKHPLAFLLVYCDLIHEWGRESQSNVIKYSDLKDLTIHLTDDDNCMPKNDDTIRNRIKIKNCKNKAIIYSKIKIISNADRKEIEVHNCFKNLKSEIIDFSIVVNKKLFRG